ncbi:MAG: winged helix-turn-helix transcriptional regulator [Saprospiraceae bacterium]|nr:winged helix-turn-helix transcriptional regulator [Saprospiraceae bacterium]
MFVKLKIYFDICRNIKTTQFEQSFKALNDPIRRDILDLLKDKDMSAGDIADHFNIGKPTISHHLDLLRQAGLVTSEKQGQFIIYSISATVLDEMLQWIYQIKSK